jgi:hypothetical protein
MAGQRQLEELLMPRQNIRIPAFTGGKTTVSQSRRAPHEFETMDNAEVDPTRGCDKRAGTEHVAGGGTREALDIAEPGNTPFIFWIDRSATERFVGLIDPDAADNLNLIQIFNVTTGNEVTVEALDSSGSEVALDDADSAVAALRTYLTSGSVLSNRELYRVVSVEDSTFILNREVTVALKGTAITYENSDSPSEVRNQNNDQNVQAWSDFSQPPSLVASYPSDATLVAGGSITNDAIWYAREDDVGLPQGFWWATSTTQPPWFQRLPTEGANSFIDETTMPIRLAYDGTKFVLQPVDWTPRYAGDSTTNPGPTFVGIEIQDMSFHQGRFWFTAGERIASSRAGDLFNLWIDSTNLVTDADPIDTGIQGRRISNGVYLESFRESLICLTDASRQVEVRANGPLTPFSFQIYDSTNVKTEDYVKPTTRGSRLYFAGERDFSNIIWEYDYSPQQITNDAYELSRRVRGYIPAELFWMTSSDAHAQLFFLTLADTDAVYVNRVDEEGGQRNMNAWYRWVFPDVDNVMSCYVYDDYLYLLMRRGSLIYLERMPLGEPPQDTDGSPAQTLSYAVRLDRKAKVQGSYDSGTDTTTWTLPYEATTSTFDVVLAPTWDTDDEKGGGTVVNGFTASTVGGVTVLSIEGDYENNADGDDAPAFIGLRYNHEVELSEQFVRDESGLPLHGNTTIMRGKVRHRDSGGYKVEITPEGRSTLTKTYVVPFIGSTVIDGDQLDDFGEFQFRIMAHGRNLTMKLINDSPFPTSWVDMEFDAEFIPFSYSPTR